MIWYSTLQHPLIGDLLLVADERRLLRSSYLDSELAPKPAEEWICDPTQQVLAKAISQLYQYFQGGAKSVHRFAANSGHGVPAKGLPFCPRGARWRDDFLHGVGGQAENAESSSFDRGCDWQESPVNFHS
jgi:hypothetical protein